MLHERYDKKEIPEGHLFDPVSPGDWYRITAYEPIEGMIGGIMSYWERDPDSVISVRLPVDTSDVTHRVMENPIS